MSTGPALDSGAGELHARLDVVLIWVQSGGQSQACSLTQPELGRGFCKEEDLGRVGRGCWQCRSPPTKGELLPYMPEAEIRGVVCVLWMCFKQRGGVPRAPDTCPPRAEHLAEVGV